MTLTNKKWWKAAGVRALKTFAQAAASYITIGATLGEIDWIFVLSASAVAAIYSLLSNIGGVPEVSTDINKA